MKRSRVLDAENIFWLEEPTRHDDYDGMAKLASALNTPIQIGENFSQVTAMAVALAAKASDFVIPDLERIGGVTGWLQAAALASAYGMEMSSHLFPEISAHLLAVTPTSYSLEYVDWANVILQEPLQVINGEAMVPDRPGSGLTWDADAVRHYRLA